MQQTLGFFLILLGSMSILISIITILVRGKKNNKPHKSVIRKGGSVELYTKPGQINPFVEKKKTDSNPPS